jgi:hypothetical protein
MPKIVIIRGKSLCELLICGIYLLTAIGLSSGGSTHLHKNNIHNNTNNKRTPQITSNVGECGSCLVFASFTLAFAVQLRKKHENRGKRQTEENARQLRKKHCNYSRNPRIHCKRTQELTHQYQLQQVIWADPPVFTVARHTSWPTSVHCSTSQELTHQCPVQHVIRADPPVSNVACHKSWSTSVHCSTSYELTQKCPLQHVIRADPPESTAARHTSWPTNVHCSTS